MAWVIAQFTAPPPRMSSDPAGIIQYVSTNPQSYYCYREDGVQCSSWMGGVHPDGCWHIDEFAEAHVFEDVDEAERVAVRLNEVYPRRLANPPPYERFVVRPA